MGLAVETIKDMFNFVLKYPKSFLFSFIINVFVLLGAMIMVGGVLVFLLPAFKTAIQSSSFFGFSTLLLSNVSGVIGAAVLAIIGLVIIVIASLLAAGGFPLLVRQAVKTKRISFYLTFHLAFKRLFKIFITNLILVLIILLFLSPAFVFMVLSLNSVVSTELLLMFAAVVIISVVIAVFLGIKFWLVMPVLMIENRNPMESIRVSWKLTRGHTLSIIGTSILFALTVSLPLAILDVLFGYGGTFVYLIWTLIRGIVTVTMVGILPTIYYFNRKSLRK